MVDPNKQAHTHISECNAVTLMWDLWDLLRVAPTTFSYRKTELDLLIQALEDTTSTSDFLFLDEV